MLAWLKKWLNMDSVVLPSPVSQRKVLFSKPFWCEVEVKLRFQKLLFPVVEFVFERLARSLKEALSSTFYSIWKYRKDEIVQKLLFSFFCVVLNEHGRHLLQLVIRHALDTKLTKNVCTSDMCS